MQTTKRKQKKISYAKWGYIFIVSFFVVYTIFTLIPQVITIYDSLFDFREVVADPYSGKEYWCGFANYKTLLTPNKFTGEVQILKYLLNTIVMWVLGAVPQMVIALLLALIFTGTRLKIKGLGFFKTVFYMPNLIMASAFGAMILMIFGSVGPVHTLLIDNLHWISNDKFDFMLDKTWSRMLVAFLNFLMWFGNTTILLMAGIQGIDESIFEAARIDGADSKHVLFDITLPLLRPIIVYVFVTSMIGGLQMFDVPQVMTSQNKNGHTKTIVMYLSETLKTKNYGLGGAISVLLFIVTGILSLLVYKGINRKED